MTEITEEELSKEINKILDSADLSKTTSKKVRQKLEKVFDTDLTDRKKLIDKLVMDYMNSKESDEDDDDDEEEEEEVKEVAKKPKKRSAPKHSEESTDGDSGSDYEDSEAAAKKSRQAKKAPKAKKTGGKGKGTGYTRTYKLSPALAELMGEDEMARHEVVKHVWAMVKEKNLYDPNNKQYAVCDKAMHKVFGVKRFRIFGMLKHLKHHFLD